MRWTRTSVGSGARVIWPDVVARGAVTMLVSVALLGVVSRLRIEQPTYAAIAGAAMVGAVATAGVVWFASTEDRAGSWRGSLASAALLAAIPTVWFGLVLQGTHYYLGGISIDQSFRTQALARYASTPGLVDMNYIELPSYYPAAWFWLGGRAAALAGIPGWEFYKLWAILTLAVTGWVAHTAWRFVVSPARAALLAAATAVTGMAVSSAEPYAWLLAAPMPALAILVWRALRGGPRHLRVLVAIGVYLGASATVYSLHAGFFGLFVVVAALLPVRGPGRPVLRIRLLRAALTVAIGLVLALVVWAPYVRAVLSGAPSTSSAQRYLPEDGALWPFPMLQVSVVGAICLVGTVWLAMSWEVHARLARPLAALCLLVYVWFALTVLALPFGQTTLAFRLTPVAELALVCSGVLGAAEGLARARSRWPGSGPALTTLAAALTVVALASTAQSSIDPGGDLVKWAYSDPYPSTGAPALGPRDPTSPEAWTPELVAAISELDRTPASDVVVLGGTDQLYAGTPYHGFQQSTPHYANPLAQYQARNDAIRSWAASAGPDDLVRGLDSSPWPAPTVFLLLRQSDGSGSARIADDAFPRYPNVEFRSVTFRAGLFDSPSFVVRNVGPYLVAVRRAVDAP